MAQNEGPARIELVKQPDWSRLTLHELLSQPVLLFKGEAVAGTPVSATYSSHSALLDNSPFHLDKIRGYMGLRATVVYRLVINADKFTSGRWVLSAQPINPYFNQRRTDFRHISQLLNVEADLNVDTEVSLKVPFRGPYTHFDIANRRNDPALFRVTEYLPHRGNNVSWSLFASFEDIELLGPTAFTTTPEYEGDLLIEEKNTPLSQKVGALSTFATAFSAVPVLSSIMAPVAWATGVASGVLSAFGYSRPQKTTTPEVFFQRAVGKLNQTDGVDYADQLAMTTTTGVQISDEIGYTSNDEMSFAHLCGMNCALTRVTTAINQETGTKLFTATLSPESMFAPCDIGNAFILHPMAYIANCFDMYRGSISMTIEFAKTVMHSGRYLVVFEPLNAEQNAGTRINTIEDAVNCHRDIIDLRKGNSFTLKFPFTATTPYLPMHIPYGRVHVFVMNALTTTPSIASGIIDFGVKFRACEDMEFAGPTDPYMYPMIPTATTAAYNPGDIGPETLVGVYESGLEVTDAEVVHKMIGDSSEPVTTLSPAALCVGERVMSMKQVAMRSKLIRHFAGTQIPVECPFNVDLLPDYDFFGDDTFVPPVTLMHDWYSYVGGMYQFARGGVVLTVHNQSGGQNVLVTTRVGGQFPRVNQPDEIARYNEFGLQHLIRSDETDRIYLPPYNYSYVRYTVNTNLTTVRGDRNRLIPSDRTERGLSQTSITMHGVNDGLPAGGLKVWRAAADDTQFGGFTGVPYCVVRAPYNGLANYRFSNPITAAV